MKNYLLIVLIVAGGLSHPVLAATQYLPVAVAPGLESDLQRLATLGELSGLKRPYSLAAVRKAMEKVKVDHPQLYGRLQRALRNYGQGYGVTQANIQGAYSSKEAAPLPNALGASTEEHYALGLTGYMQPTEYFIATVSGEVSDERSTASGSLLSLGTHWMQLDLGYKAYWLSPFQGSSQLLSTHAETLPSIALSNYQPINILGTKWSYELFTAQMGRQPTLYNNQFSDKKGPLLTGVHVALHATSFWTLSVTRMLQYGGGERPLSLDTFLTAFFDPKNGDNEASVDEESGNQLGALASQMHFAGPMPFTFAIELGAEDTSDFKVYRPGNPSLTAGLYFPAFFSPKVALNVEYASWDNAWYVNNVYAEGYSHKGYVLGNWALQDQKRGRTAAPGDSYFAFVQWLLSPAHSLDISGRYVNHSGNDSAGQPYEPGWQFEAEYRWTHRSLTYGFAAHTGEDSFGEAFNQFRFRVQWR